MDFVGRPSHPEAVCVGSAVRHKRTRDLGLVKSIDVASGFASTLFRGTTEERIALHELQCVEQCGECQLWREKSLCCAAGHWRCLEERKELFSETVGAHFKFERREDRCVGLLLTCLIGDALGAPFEGHGAMKIKFAMKGGKPNVFIPGTQMGIREAGERVGMYTDDGLSSLALANCLVENDGVIDAQKIALEYAKFFDFEPKRGLPDSAKKVLDMCKGGHDIRCTGASSFPFGSFANGAAMRISSLACILPPEATMDQVYGFVCECVASSHVHPDAIDSAFIQTLAVCQCLQADAETFNPQVFLDSLIEACRTEPLRKRLMEIRAGVVLVRESRQGEDDEEEITDAEFFEACGVDQGFQLYGPDAIATVLWCFVRYFKEGPEQILIRCVALGGDCDTTASILGCMLGALYGTSWIPIRWAGLLENGPHGRDFAIDLGKRLAHCRPARCAEQHLEFFQHPLSSFIASAIPPIREALKISATDNILDNYNPVKLPTFGNLWDRLFDLVALNGVIRYDIAMCLVAFFTEYAPKTQMIIHDKRSFNKQQWNELFVELVSQMAKGK